MNTTGFRRRFNRGVLYMVDDIHSKHVIELLKYPVIAASALLLLLGVRFLVGVEFGLVTEVSTEGVKFAERKSEETVKALTSLEGRLNEVTLELEQIKNALPDAYIAVSSAKRLEATETVSDQTANIEKVVSPGAPGDKELLNGYIWIGNFDKQGWHNPRIGYKDSGQPIQGEPNSLSQGTEYQVLGNMVLRAGPPPENGRSIKEVQSLGVVPRGTVVRLIGEPVSKDKGERDPYWVEVEVSRRDTR